VQEMRAAQSRPPPQQLAARSSLGRVVVEAATQLKLGSEVVGVEFPIADGHRSEGCEDGVEVRQWWRVGQRFGSVGQPGRAGESVSGGLWRVTRKAKRLGRVRWTTGGMVGGGRGNHQLWQQMQGRCGGLGAP
jgi:hypothetical protein